MTQNNANVIFKPLGCVRQAA